MEKESGDNITVRTTCRVCGFNELTPILALGDLHVSDFLDENEAHEDIPKHPLELVLCSEERGGCGLLQLKHTVPHEKMYRNYWYRSGLNQTMTDELNGIANKVESIVALGAGDSVIDIGANDGTLLRGYSAPHINRVGFEPARNLGEHNKKGTTKIFNDFFNHAAWEKEFPGKRAKAVTAIAMFYDLEDPNRFVSDVAKCLDPEGVFIIQMSYLPLMLSQNAFDNICHEHLEYYSLLSLEHLLKRNGLEVFDVELNDVNGGSYRVYIKHAGKGKTIKVSPGAQERVLKLRAEEKALGLHGDKAYADFVHRVQSIREKLKGFIDREVAQGKKVYVYGASTKGNTLLQYFDLKHPHIEAAAERNSDKWGKRTVGTMIPIVSEADARKAQPDYFLVLPWHFMGEFEAREKEFLARGGKFIVPLPELKLVSEEGGKVTYSELNA